MDTSDFQYDLPTELIAQFPAEHRTDARLLVLDRRSASIAHSTVAALPEFLAPGDLLVLNDTRVFPARLWGTRVPSGGVVECLLITRLGAGHWEALMHPGQKLRPGEVVVFRGGSRVLHGEVLERRFFGRRVIRLWTDDGSDVDQVVEEIGHVPLPPYIKRPDEPTDRLRYQTVYARATGSVAAPTAGLHLSEALLDRLGAGGVERAQITLHVGYGTFKPVRVARAEEHRVDSEWFEVSETAAEAISRARRERRRVVAVGTTTTRALESVAEPDGDGVQARSGATELFIYPGFRFRVVDALLTNFHLPRFVAADAGLRVRRPRAGARRLSRSGRGAVSVL